VFTVAPVFRQLWTEPVAGATFATDENEQTVVRFVERATGHVYEAYPTTTKITRLTNTTLPRIQEVLWTSHDTLLMRYLREDDDTIETFAAKVVVPEQATTTVDTIGMLEGQFLPTDILHVTSANNTLFYLLKQGAGVRGVVSATDGSGAREVFSSTIRDWLPQWINNSTVALTTKASGDIPGHLFFLDTTSGAFESVLSNIMGLTTNASANAVLYAELKGNIPLLFSRNTTSGRIVALPVSTLPEKCTKGAVGSGVIYCATPKGFGGQALPDAWYQGVIHFNDEVWEIDTQTLSKERVLNPGQLGTGTFDLVDLLVDEAGENLLFRNKIDNTLWLYQLGSQNLNPEIESET